MGPFALDDEEEGPPKWDHAYGDETPSNDEYGPMADDTPLADAEDFPEPEVYDKLIGAKVVLDQLSDGRGNIATVKKRATDTAGRPLGQAHRITALDNREYEVELEDGTTERIMANKIAANIYSQLDDEGREVLVFRDIIDHRKNGHVLSKETGFTVLKNGHKKCKPTTWG